MNYSCHWALKSTDNGALVIRIAHVLRKAPESRHLSLNYSCHWALKSPRIGRLWTNSTSVSWSQLCYINVRTLCKCLGSTPASLIAAMIISIWIRTTRRWFHLLPNTLWPTLDILSGFPLILATLKDSWPHSQSLQTTNHRPNVHNSLI